MASLPLMAMRGYSLSKHTHTRALQLILQLHLLTKDVRDGVMKMGETKFGIEIVMGGTVGKNVNVTTVSFMA